jgi:hypothetical protein
MNANPEKHILESWHSNAAAWTNAIEQQSIESRRLITNKAIVDTIGEQDASDDIGCWLRRRVVMPGIG